jgi:membrane protease subunit (stomatin/prohibitin family)
MKKNYCLRKKCLPLQKNVQLNKLKSMATKTYAQKVSDATVLVQGIRDNQEVLGKRQIDNVFADSLQADIDTAVTLNNEQESLKAKLKAKTAELDAVMTTLAKKTGEARKIIKIDMPQSSWREFGINDKR